MNVQHEKSRLFALLGAMLKVRSYPKVTIKPENVHIARSPIAPGGPMVVVSTEIGNYTVYKPRLKRGYNYQQYSAAVLLCDRRAKLVREWVKEYNEQRGHN